MTDLSSIFLAALLGSFIGTMLGINVRLLMIYRAPQKFFGRKDGE